MGKGKLRLKNVGIDKMAAIIYNMKAVGTAFSK
jgi:hypothetical protein